MAGPLDPARVPLVGLADVDQLRVLVAPQRVDLLGRDVPFPGHRAHGTQPHDPVAILASYVAAGAR